MSYYIKLELIEVSHYDKLDNVWLMCAQGRISNIGKLGTCLGRQLYRGGTPTKKKKKEKKKKKIRETNSTHLLHSHLTLLQYRLIWYQNNGNFISFLPLQVVAFYK